MGDLDELEDRADLASPITRGAFEQCYEMLAEVAISKGFLMPSNRSRRSESPANDEGDADRENVEADEVGRAMTTLSTTSVLFLYSSRPLAKKEKRR
jgi:hypothetical protein